MFGKTSVRKKIIITGGHLTPALAVIELMEKCEWEVIFIGRKYAFEGEKTLSAEYRITRKLGLPFISLTSGRWQRNLTRHTFFSLLKIPIGFFQSFYWLIKLHPHLILSFGGYLALPVAMAGWFLGIPVVTHEQAVNPGLANQIINFFAKKVAVSWPETLEKIKGKKIILTGNPIRKEIFAQTPNPKPQIPKNDLPLIYITGGSTGSHAINEVIKNILPQLLEKYNVIHQCGDSQEYKDYEKLLKIKDQLPPLFKNRYFVVKYLDFLEIGSVLKKADLVVGRSGANTITELAALGKPAILIPLPWAGQNEQFENAKILEKAGIAVILEQKNLTGETLYNNINTLSQNLEQYKKNGRKAKELVDLKAAEKILDIMQKFPMLQ